jgi:MFS family permease
MLIQKQKFLDSTKIGFKYNKIIQLLTFSDCFLTGGYLMINATVAIYLQEKLASNSFEVISIGISIFMISKSLFQIPISRYLDKLKSYKDETLAIALSSVLISLGIFGLKFITQPFHLYICQFIIGLGFSINLPSWRKTFAKFVDKGYEALEFSINDVFYNISIAALIFLGGLILNQTGDFQLVFTLSSVLVLIGGFIMLFLLREKKIINTA